MTSNRLKIQLARQPLSGEDGEKPWSNLELGVGATAAPPHAEISDVLGCITSLILSGARATQTQSISRHVLHWSSELARCARVQRFDLWSCSMLCFVFSAPLVCSSKLVERVEWCFWHRGWKAPSDKKSHKLLTLSIFFLIYFKTKKKLFYKKYFTNHFYFGLALAC